MISLADPSEESLSLEIHYIQPEIVHLKNTTIKQLHTGFCQFFTNTAFCPLFEYSSFQSNIVAEIHQCLEGKRTPQK